MKKLISVLLLLLLFSQCAFAAARIPVYKVGNVLYFFDKSSGTITGFAGEPADLVIPTVLNGNAVVSVGEGAFSGSQTLSTLTIPYGIYSVCADAFNNCPNLKSVHIGGSVSFIGKGAFANCQSLSSVTFDGDVASIDAGAFDSTKWITSADDEFVMLGKSTLLKYNGSSAQVVIPSGVTEISDSAFASHSEISSVTLPSGLEKIGANAFVHCYALSDISIPESVINIGAGAFDDTAWLANQPGNYVSVNGILIAYRGNSRCIEIPQGITGIGSGAFMANEFVEYVNIPESVLYIDSYAFLNCSNLIWVNLPWSMEWIDETAFAGCIRLALNVAEGSYSHTYAQAMEIVTVKQAGIIVNGKSPQYTGIAPLMLYDSVYTPLRPIMEALGYELLYDSASAVITCKSENRSIKIMPDGNVEINSRPADFKAPPILFWGTTLFPARVVAQIADCNIEWDANNVCAIYSSR